MAVNHRLSQKGWKSGWERGYQSGAAAGYHLGRCEAVRRQVPEFQPGWWDVRLMYVVSGKGFPYSPLDHSIVGTLKGLVRELITIDPREDLTAAAASAQPDFVLVLEGLNVTADKIDSLRSLGVKTAIWLTDDPYYTDATLSLVAHYDIVFTLEQACVSFYEQNGCRQVHYLPFAANPAVFRPRSIPVHYRHDISFIGSAYWNRVAFFDRIVPYLARKNTYISGLWWDRLRKYRQIAHRIELNKWMEAEETAAYYIGSRIVINLHRATDDETYNQNSRKIGAVSPNPRTFEIAGCGTLQMTDIRGDIARFYEPGKEIVTYSSPEELVHKIDYYLNHEEERLTIALNALRRTLQEHTYVHRLDQMLRIMFGEPDRR